MYGGQNQYNGGQQTPQFQQGPNGQFFAESYPMAYGGGQMQPPQMENWAVNVQVGLKNNVFYPGNIIEGVVTIKCSQAVQFNAVRLKFTGKEKVHIQRDEKIPDGPPRPPPNGQGPPVQHYKTIKRSYFSANVIMKKLITLAGDFKYTRTGNGNYTMMPGQYTYPFAFQLPYDLAPSFVRSFSDDTASIVYYAKAYVDLIDSRDAVAKSFFSVVRPMPASQWAHREPATVNQKYDVTCCCCVSKGHINALISMDRTCIAIDRDWLQLFADIDGTKCEEPVENLVVTLRHTLSYSANGFTESTSYAAGSKTLGNPIPVGGKGLVNGVIELPRNLMPSFKTPNVSSSYVLTVQMTIPWASDPVQAFPVVVGQSVDESNMSPPLPFKDFGTLKFTPPRAPCEEFFYQTPANPVYAYVPITQWTPPPNYAFMPQPSFNNNIYLPAQSWAQGNPPPAPFGNGAPMNMTYEWQTGYEQPYAQDFNMGQPPTQPMGYGQPQQQLPPPPGQQQQGAYYNPQHVQNVGQY